MHKNKLGLPLEYKKFPEYFDAHNIGEDTNAKNAVVEKLLKTHNIKTVLDFTCGTGSQVFHLTKNGYKVTGADFSPALLEIARQKAIAAKFDIKFIAGDMRTLKVGTFDAVITMFNAVGHLTKAGFAKAMKNIAENLKTGGIYIFDIFNVQAMTDEAVRNLDMETNRSVDETQIHNLQHSEIDRKTGQLTSYDNYTITKNGAKPKKISHKFSLQLYKAKELKEMLAKNGFETMDQYAMDGSPFHENETKSILTVTRKK